MLEISTPILLQQILRAMQSLGSPRHDAITFALFSLFIRLLDALSAVLRLWYSRRCYERSRGEMITMVFEKTLNRKVISPPKKEDDAENATDLIDHSSTQAQSLKTEPKFMFRKTYRRLRNMFRRGKSTEAIKEPASMGKILNIMRQVEERS